jgi:pimeloyl-ACP methyl ester carboxylesterase
MGAVRPALRKIVLGASGGLILAYAGLCIFGHFAYRTLLYPAPPPAPMPVPPAARLIERRAADGAMARALEFPPRDPSARTVVFFHSNGDTVANELPLAEDLRRRGLGVVLAEYRGYGLSRDAGLPDEAGLYEDGRAVLDAIEEQGTGADRVVLLGVSLGTGVAAELARQGRAAALILVSPFTSVTAMARRTVPLLPAAWLCPDRFDTLSKASGIHMPTLVIHGENDEYVPLEMGRAVARAIPGAVLRVVAGGRHTDLLVNTWPSVVDAIVEHAAR